jgi:ABC-type molybdate transport system substrate-binding protein
MQPTEMPRIPSDRADDLHFPEDSRTPDLVLFMAGNQFMLMDELRTAFQEEHPDIASIYYETLPPGLELKQIIAGGALFKDKVIDIAPDIYTSVSKKGMHRLIRSGHIDAGDERLYLRNRLTLMVPEGNPAGIESISDLGRDEIRISQPDPTFEDIGHHIVDMYKKAGGRALVERIMETKRAEGTSIYTVVHHRETPIRIAKGTVDVGPVWATEITPAKSSGIKCESIEPGQELDQRERIEYYICTLKRAPNPRNAAKFMRFIFEPTAQEIYARYGFIPVK